MPFKILTVFVIFIVKNSLCANILIACPVPSPSHQIWNYALAEGLIAKGHNITMASPDANMHKASDKYHPIVFEDVAVQLMASKAIDIEGSPNQNIIQLITSFYAYVFGSCKYLYPSNGFKQILDYPKDYKFDLIIMDMTIGPCLYPLIQKFNYPPTIGVTAFLLPPFLSFAFGNYLPTSYLPFYHLNYPENMSFFQRVANYLMTNFDLILTQMYATNEFQKLANEAFGEDMQSLSDLERHISLLLSNINPALHYPQPLTPNIIPVGGLHAKPPKPLPQDFREIMDNSTNGVILMALGTNVRADKLEKKRIDALLDAFSKLKQTVLWKFESNFDNLPRNVFIRKFLPQNDILGHPQTKIFITHGGGLSTLETAYHGVPILGIPFFVDQYMLTNAMVEKKLGLKLELKDVTSENVLKKINELLNKSEYSKNIKDISRRMKDQISTPLETAVFWAEHALRHNGSHYLNPRSRDMSLFVSSSTDVVIFLLVTLLISLNVLYLFVRLLHNVLYRKSKKQKIN